MKLDRSIWPVAVVVTTGAVGAVFSTTIANVAVADLARELDTDIGTVQWVATAYLLGLAASMSSAGWLARRVGARRLYLTSLLLFCAGSALCAAAWSIESLIAARVLQGIAGGPTMPVGQMMLATAAGPSRMGRVMSVVGIPLILSPVIGPTIGGVVIHFLSWHWIFLMTIPLPLAAFAIGWRILPPMPARPAGPFDLGGFLLMVSGPALVVYGLALAGHGRSAVALAAIALGAALMAAFVLRSLRAPQPLLDVRLWQKPAFAACAVTAVLVSGTLFGSLFLLPLAFQQVLGASVMGSALLLLPQGVGAAVSIGVAGWLTDRIGGGRVAVAGIAVLGLCTVPFVLFGPDTPMWLVATVLFVRGIGVGASIMPALAAAYFTLDRREIPDASPQLNVLQRIGGSLGTTLFTIALVGGAHDIAGPGVTAVQAAGAFHDAFAWTVGATLLALIPAGVLTVIEKGRGAPLPEAVVA